MLLKAIETVQAGGTAPGAADRALARPDVGTGYVDGIAPAGTWPTWWLEQVSTKRAGAPWSEHDPASPATAPVGLHDEFRATLRDPPTRSEKQALRRTERLIDAAASNWFGSSGATCMASRRQDAGGFGRGQCHGGRCRPMGQHIDAQGQLRRTAFNVFEPGGAANSPASSSRAPALAGRPESFRQTALDRRYGLGQRQPWFQDGTPVELDTRRVLQRALARLADAGYA
jgi:hypothetical protein